VLQPKPGDLLACRWDPDEPGEQDSFRVIEVVAVGTEAIDVLAYGDRFASPPTELDVTALRPIRLHGELGGSMQVARRELETWAPTPVRRLGTFDAEVQLHRAVSMVSAGPEDDAFVEESARARELVAAQLRLLWRRCKPDAHLDCFEPSAPMAPFAVIRSPEGETLAQVIAHASGAGVLIGEHGALCAFDDPTAEERADHVYGAVAAVLALNMGDALA
jgi:hypothetical protein